MSFVKGIGVLGGAPGTFTSGDVNNDGGDSGDIVCPDLVCVSVKACTEVNPTPLKPKYSKPHTHAIPSTMIVVPVFRFTVSLLLLNSLPRYHSVFLHIDKSKWRLASNR